jgi:hypothetical protein
MNANHGTLSEIATIFCFIILFCSLTSAAAGQSEIERITSFTPAEKGIFPNDDYKPYYTVYGASDVKFRALLIDDNFPGGSIAQTAICDFTGDGKPEYHVGSSEGKFIYKPLDDGTWTRYQIRKERGPTDVGAVGIDLTGNGLCDIIAGSAWYENPGFENGDFLKESWDEYDYAEDTGGNPGIHDQILADISGNGRLDMITLHDGSNPSGVRWYKIPEDPHSAWERSDIGVATHKGIAPKGYGDLNGNGKIDIIRADIWWENSRGDGTWWRPHSLGAIHSLPPERLDDAVFVNGTQTWVADINGNGLMDIVQADGEGRGGRIWWIENMGPNIDGSVNWQRHIIAGGLRNIVNGESVYLGRVMGGIHSLCVGDFSGNDRPDIFTIEHDLNRARPGADGEEQPRAFLWENLGEGFDGTILFHEHVIADINLGGHDSVCADMTGNGKPDIITKPWNPSDRNALNGKGYILFLENLSN